MAGWIARLALVFLGLAATACAGCSLLGAASAQTQVTELIVTCLSCGEQWLFAPSATVSAGLLSLLTRKKIYDRCSKCGSRAVTFAHAAEHDRHHGRIA
jgi:hypothetical protein